MIINEFIIKNGDYNIDCNLYHPFIQKEKAEKIILACHGFDSSKNSDKIHTMAKYAERYDIPVISFNWPSHGNSIQPLTVEGCIDVLHKVEETIYSMYPNAKIILYGSSFGGYMLLLYLSRHKSSFIDKRCDSVFLKSPAIKMNEIFKNELIDEEIQDFRQRGYTIKNRNKKMKIPYQFYKELNENIIKPEDIDQISQKIFVFHGTNDEVASIEAVKAIQGENITLIELKDAPHSFDGKYFERMIEEMFHNI